MPIKHYLPKIQRYWSGQIWELTILRDYGIQLDFRKGTIWEQLKHPKKNTNKATN